MIKVTGNNGNTIYYKCDCGTKGFCTIKPVKKDAAIVIDVTCPSCSEIERVVVLQYSSEENKEKILKNLNESDLTWTPVIDNDSLEEN